MQRSVGIKRETPEYATATEQPAARAPTAEKPQWVYMTSRTEKYPTVGYYGDMFTMYDAFTTVDDANHKIRTLAKTDPGRPTPHQEWKEEWGSHGELTLDSRGENAGDSDWMILKVTRMPLRTVGYIEPPKKQTKRSRQSSEEIEESFQARWAEGNSIYSRPTPDW